ncbi:unnamed protein product [Gadus morhua 'NCC']
MDLDIRKYLNRAREQKDVEAVRLAYQLITDALPDGGGARRPCCAAELLVLCAEEALQLGCMEISVACLKSYFEGNPATNQFLCRAYLCKGQLRSPATSGNADDFQSALLYFQKAIEISKNNPRYHFLVFNTSLRFLQAMRPLLRPGLRGRLAPSLALLVSALEEVAEPDYSWRAELMIHLVECLVDAGRREDACRYSTVTSEFVASHAPHLYPEVLTLMARYQLLGDSSPDMTTHAPSGAVLHKILKLKNRVEGGERESCLLSEEDVVELKEVFSLLAEHAAGPHAVMSGETPTNTSQTSAAIPPAERVVLLMELAVLGLQWKQQEVVASCLKELRSAKETMASQHVMLECFQCELNVLRKQEKMSVYSKAGIEARLKEIGKLDRLLRRVAAAGEADPRAVQAVCATQWSVCLPLLQRNLRKRVRAELQRVAQALEDINSMLLETRCEVHQELALLEEEEGRLEASLGHLERAVLLADGPRRERLLTTVHRLRLRATLYSAPSRPEDRAAMLLQQAKDKAPKDSIDIRSTLVQAGLLLAPDAFQIVLDADCTPESSDGTVPALQLSAKAKHHSWSVQGVKGHLERLADDNNATERVNVWAVLVKAARGHEVWDVCRAACRFCLLYDDGRWTEKGQSPEQGSVQINASSRDVLLLLAEICFINAEATVQKLQSEGVELNSPAVLPQDRGGPASEDQWGVYRDWIQSLSAYATAGFLRGAELGEELGEWWMVDNAAVYLWNYSRPLLAACEYRTLLPAFQTLVDTLRRTGHYGDQALLMLLCDCVARGLLQPLLGRDGVRTKKGAGRTPDKAGSTTHVGGTLAMEPAALKDLNKALEVCEFALRLSSVAVPGGAVSMVTRKQVLATWVQIKRLLQQPVSQTKEIGVECKGDESVAAMTRVLVAVEMHLCCNRDGVQVEPAVPGLSSLVRAASDCAWSDAAAELQVWSQLASLCHHGDDHNLVLHCTQAALLLEGAASRGVSGSLYGPNAVNEMLSCVAGLRGLSLAHQSSGDLHKYKEALHVLLSSVSFAEKAQSLPLCRAAARHYWNTCLPLTRAPADRQQLQGPLERILSALCHTGPRQTTQGEAKGRVAATTTAKLEELTNDEDDEIGLRAGMYQMLFRIHGDQGDWERALQVLDKGVRELPRTQQRLLLLQQRTLVRARLGQSVGTDMLRLKEEGEHVCSSVWHQVALCSPDTQQQLASFQSSVASLSEQGAEGRWQKADLLMQFAEWLYGQNQPLQTTQHHLHWAVDLLVQLDPELAQETDDPSKDSGPADTLGPDPPLQAVVRGASILTALQDVRCLDGLIRAHTLLGFMEPRTSPGHQENLLRAYVFVLHTWNVSMATVREVLTEMAKALPVEPPSSAASRKEKSVVRDKGKGKKTKEAQQTPRPPTEEKPQQLFQEEELTLPSTPTEWARYVCPHVVRETFRTSGAHHCISKPSFPKQAQSLFYLDLLVRELTSLSLPHLSLPVLHLAETIAHDLVGRKGLSDLYRLRIVRTCCQLGMEAHSPYQDELLDLSSLREQELIDCRKAIFIARQRRSQNMLPKQSSSAEPRPEVRLHQRRAELSSEGIWLDKAEVCLSIGLYPSARWLLVEGHLLAKEVGQQEAEARALLGLAGLACAEGDHGQALELLDRAQDLGGDEEFWYKLTLTRVQATASLGDQEAGAKVDLVIQQGCAVLRSVLGQRPNRAPRLRLWIASLETRRAAECIRLVSHRGPGETISAGEALRLTQACHALRDAARESTQLGQEEQAAQAHLEHATGLRVLARHAGSDDEEKRHLLDSVCRMQEAVSLQEHALLRAWSWAPSQESPGVTLVSMRRLQRLRLSLAELCLATLEQLHAEEEVQAHARRAKTSAQRALEDFTCHTPEPGCLDQEWASSGPALAQVALCQLAAVHTQCAGTRAGGDGADGALCSALTGKCLRLLAARKHPLHPSDRWDPTGQANPYVQMEGEQRGGRSGREGEEKEDSKATSTKRGDLKGGRVGRSASSSDLQRKHTGSVQVFSQASEALARAIGLCLQHGLHSSILAEASLNMLECHGQLDPAMTGQYLALYQSCRSSAAMAEVLASASSGASGASRLSSFLGLLGDLHHSQEETPSSRLRALKDHLTTLSQAYRHLAINPNHLSILGELPPNLTLLLLQHNQDGSKLYGALYEKVEPMDHQKGKAAQSTAVLTCTRVAKVQVSPGMLLALRGNIRTFARQTGEILLDEARRHSSETGHAPQSSRAKTLSGEQEQAAQFRAVVEAMENYLHPIISQLDCSRFSNPRKKSPSGHAQESERLGEKEEKQKGLAKDQPACPPQDPGVCVVLLADQWLQELPLEALSVLQGRGVGSVSRDFSLQLLHARLHRDQPEKVEGDNKQETKGAKAAKGKGDQSRAIKVPPVNRVLPPHAFPVDARDFKYIVDPYSDYSNYEGGSLAERMKVTLDDHSQQGTSLWDGFMGSSRHTPSLAQVEQLLAGCSGFIYLGTERFMANVPPVKLAAMDLSECHLALIFDLLQNRASAARQSNLDLQKSAGRLALEGPVETALLLSLCGVRCVALHQWHSSPRTHALNVAALLDGLLAAGLSSGQALHSLRKGDRGPSGAPPSNESTASGSLGGVYQKADVSWSSFNCILYGIPNLVIE